MLAFVIGAFVAPPGRLLLWAPAFLVAGISCLVNARRCGRFHCFMTGPLYLLAAVATVAAAPWGWIAVSVVGGTIAAYAVEYGCGKYRSVTQDPSRVSVSTCTSCSTGAAWKASAPDLVRRELMPPDHALAPGKRKVFHR
jgi:hypothetical protein